MPGGKKADTPECEEKWQRCHQINNYQKQLGLRLTQRSKGEIRSNQLGHC